MDLKKSKVILKKINALHESAEAFDGKLSAIERDLLLHYVRDLYESLQGEPSGKQRKAKKKKADREVQEQPILAKTLEPVVQEPAREVSQAPPDLDSKEEVKQVKPENGVSEEKTDSLIPADVEELFSESTEQKPGSRFENLPISDISKSMGINDRILTINDLFRGDQHAFNECIRHLNGLSSFDAAKSYLANEVAVRNEWQQPLRRNKAQSFIRLVKRRYL